MVDMVHQLQDTICDAIASLDDSTYREDEWTRKRVAAGEAVFFPRARCSKKQVSTSASSTGR